MKLIEHAMPSHEDNYMNQFMELFVEALHLEDKSYLLDVPLTPTMLSKNW